MSNVQVTCHENSFGAKVEGVDLSQPLDEDTVRTIRDVWLDHQMIYFPNQPLTHEDHARFTRYFGDFGSEPFVKTIDEHKHIIEVRREPRERVSPFGASWHSDWSFQSQPPAATLLHSKIVPPVGGETLFADGIRAFEELDAGLKRDIEHLTAIHSARRPYSHEGFARTGGDRRSMTILPSDSAWETREHPVVRVHPESGRPALWVNPVYTIAIKDMDERASKDLLDRLFSHALDSRFVYTHVWEPNMLAMWDNRTVQHCACGGYDGHLRVMHRTTVAGDTPH